LVAGTLVDIGLTVYKKAPILGAFFKLTVLDICYRKQRE
jgi:hypothetical protein